MSYSVRLRSDPDKWADRLIDPTYNLSQIFDFVLTGEPLPSPQVSEMERVLFRKEVDRPRGLCVLSGRKASDRRMRDPQYAAVFAALEPPNKWGDLPGAIYVFERMLEAAEAEPESVWDIE